MTDQNPFEFDAAPNIEPEKMVQWFISNHNYARFINSTKNVIINGERGSGKSMMLMYHSVKYQRILSDVEKKSKFDLGRVLGVYIPCLTPLFMKEEFKFLPDQSQFRYLESVFVLTILSRLSQEMIASDIHFSEHSNLVIREEIAVSLDAANDDDLSLTGFEFLKKVCRRKIRNLQKDIPLYSTGEDSPTFGDTFYDIVLPILTLISELKETSGVNVSLMFDDVQDLHKSQKYMLNSWIGYRDHSVFSIKAAVAGVRNYDFHTNHGGSLLEGHDYIALDLQKQYQNNNSEFGKFIYDIVTKRLSAVGVNTKPEDFFSPSPKLASALQNAKKRTEKEAAERGYIKGSKESRDYIYKRYRASYFRNRSGSTANKPQYSGLETLQHLSTGVVRNFLQPAYYMYEKQYSENEGKIPTKIQPDLQKNVIIERSDTLWRFVESDLSRKLPKCTSEDQEKVFNILEMLGEYFRRRLLEDIAEPCVLVFIVSDKQPDVWSKVHRILDIAEAAQLLYTRVGTSKSGGGREVYYVPNRMLWPKYGLDVHGQHGRASIKASDLLQAAENRKQIPFNDQASSIKQSDLFHE